VKIISFIFNLHYYNDAKIFILATHELDVYMNMNPYKTWNSKPPSCDCQLSSAKRPLTLHV